MSATTQDKSVLFIDNIEIRMNERGLFSLNDLHHASGGANKHRPSEWLRNQQTKDLIAEIELAGIPAITRKTKVGTYVCRELVVAYAAWIDAIIHLKVIRGFLAANGQQQMPILPEHTRLLVSLYANGRYTTSSVPNDAMILSMEKLAYILDDPGLIQKQEWYMEVCLAAFKNLTVENMLSMIAKLPSFMLELIQERRLKVKRVA